MTTSEKAYHKFRNLLICYIKKRISNADDAEDILQNVFMRIVKNELTFRKADEPLAWLYSVTHSVLIDHYRKQGREILNNNSRELNEIPALATCATNSEFEKCLQPLINGLPEKYRQAVRFVSLDEQKQADFASLTGISIAAAKSRVLRGRKMLKGAVLDYCNIEYDNLGNVTTVEEGHSCKKGCC